jgi:hypothetical protein
VNVLLGQILLFSTKIYWGFYFSLLVNSTKFQFIENFANFLISQNWGKKFGPVTILEPIPKIELQVCSVLLTRPRKQG